jgi:hypothetical protein
MVVRHWQIGGRLSLGGYAVNKLFEQACPPSDSRPAHSEQSSHPPKTIKQSPQDQPAKTHPQAPLPHQDSSPKTQRVEQATTISNATHMTTRT